MTDPLCSQEILSLDSLACDAFKVEYIRANFKAVFYAESRDHTHFFWSDQIFKIQALT